MEKKKKEKREIVLQQKIGPNNEGILHNVRGSCYNYYSDGCFYEKLLYNNRKKIIGGKNKVNGHVDLFKFQDNQQSPIKEYIDVNIKDGKIENCKKIVRYCGKEEKEPCKEVYLNNQLLFNNIHNEIIKGGICIQARYSIADDELNENKISDDAIRRNSVVRDVIVYGVNDNDIKFKNIKMCSKYDKNKAIIYIRDLKEQRYKIANETELGKFVVNLTILKDNNKDDFKKDNNDKFFNYKDDFNRYFVKNNDDEYIMETMFLDKEAQYKKYKSSFKNKIMIKSDTKKIYFFNHKNKELKLNYKKEVTLYNKAIKLCSSIKNFYQYTSDCVGKKYYQNDNKDIYSQDKLKKQYDLINTELNNFLQELGKEIQNKNLEELVKEDKNIFRKSCIANSIRKSSFFHKKKEKEVVNVFKDLLKKNNDKGCVKISYK